MKARDIAFLAGGLVLYSEWKERSIKNRRRNPKYDNEMLDELHEMFIHEDEDVRNQAAYLLTSLELPTYDLIDLTEGLLLDDRTRKLIPVIYPKLRHKYALSDYRSGARSFRGYVEARDGEKARRIFQELLPVEACVALMAEFYKKGIFKFWVLRLDKRNLSQLPEGILDIDSLSMIVLSRNKFEEFPEEIYELPHLTTLGIGGNPLRHDPVEKEKLEDFKAIMRERSTEEMLDIFRK